MSATYEPCWQHTYHVGNIHTMPATYRPCQQHTDHVGNIQNMSATYIQCRQHTDPVCNIQTMSATYIPCRQHTDHVGNRQTLSATYRPCWQHTDHVGNIQTLSATYRPCWQHTDPVGKYPKRLVLVVERQVAMLSLSVDNMRQSISTLTILRFLKVFSQQIHKPNNRHEHNCFLFNQSYSKPGYPWLGWAPNINHWI